MVFLSRCFRKKRVGFTLVEVVLTIIILSVMVSLSLAGYQTIIERTRATEGANIIKVIFDLQQVYKYENTVYSATLSDLDVTIPISENFDPPDAASVVNAISCVASIVRNDGTYTLGIEPDGNIVCAGVRCARLGY